MEPKYINVAYNIYEKVNRNQKNSYQFEKLEKVLAKYNGLKSINFTPNYSGFLSYVGEKLFKKDLSKVVPRYKAFQDTNYNELGAAEYLLFLFAKKFKEMDAFAIDYSEEQIMKDRKLQLAYMKVVNEFKLLLSVLEKMENVVAVFIQTIDSSEVEYLDENIEQLDSIAIKHRFMQAIMLKEKTMAFKLLGRLRELDPGENDYFEALAHFTNDEYEAAIRYASKVTVDQIDYGPSLALALESYAILGDTSGFCNLMKKNLQVEYGKWHIMYLRQRLISGMNHTTVDDFIFDIDKLEETFRLVKTANDGDVKNDDYFYGLVYQFFTKTILEGIRLIEEITHYKSVKQPKEVSERANTRLYQLQLIASLDENNIHKFINPDYLNKHGLEKVKKEILQYFFKALIDHNPRESYESIHTAFMLQYELGFIDDFCNNVEQNLLQLIAYYNSGKKQVGELIQLAYLERKITDNVRETLKLAVDELNLYDERMELQIKKDKLYDVLSQKGKVAFQAAEWHYEKTLAEDYGWKDAGMLSLGYFRIIELEMNEKFIFPTIDALGIDHILHVYTLTIESSNNYATKWERIIKEFKGMQTKKSKRKGLMLGSLYYFLKFIGKDYDENDEIATLFYEYFVAKLLSERGAIALRNGEIQSIISYKKREKYRNPPAHTNYLNYDIACEARDFVIHALLQFDKWLR